MKDAEVFYKTSDGTLRAPLVDSSGNVVVSVSGSTGTTAIVGDVLSDVADTGGAPIKAGGIARTANPTAVANGDRVSATFDDLGRQLITPYQVRDLVNTAYVQLTTGATSNLIAGVSGVFLDLVQISLSNSSSASVTIVLSDSSTVVQRFNIQSNDTVTCTFPTPIRQSATGDAWNVNNAGSDVSTTTVDIQAQFIRNV